MPEPFRHRIRVRFNECDGQGVVFYANYLMYFDVAMTELWREAFGGGYAGMIANGTDAMVAEANIRYRASARFDDELDLVAAVTRIGTTSTVTRLTAERVSDGAVLAEADLRHVFIDPRHAREARDSRRGPGRDGAIRRMIHLRIVAPEEQAHKALEILHGSPAVLNVVHLHGAAKKPDGDLILCDVAREEASVIIGDLKELEIPRVGSIAVEHIDTALSDAAEAAEKAAPGLPSDAVVWEEVEQRTSENTELSVSFVAFMVLAMQIGAVGILLDQPILIVGAMVVGPEFGPLAGLCRWRSWSAAADLARRSFAALGVGLPGRHRAGLPADAGLQVDRREPRRLRARRAPAHRLHLEARLLLLLRRLRGRGGGDPLPDEREVGRADRRAHLGDHDPGGLEHRRRGRLRRLA